MKRAMTVLLLASLTSAWPGAAAAKAAPPAATPATYADLAELADSALLVVRAQVRSLVVVPAERAPGVRLGHARFFVEARTRALISGAGALGESLRYLVDLPVDARGRPPALRKVEVLLFARGVPERPGELQLVSPDAQLVWDAALEARLRGVLSELQSQGAPPRIKGVREAIFVPGNLAGEGETQVFLTTADDSAAALTVARRPQTAPAWNVSFSEVAGGSNGGPARNTLAWYRLACSLPRQLPPQAELSEGDTNRGQAREDYRFILAQLGTCDRTIR